VVLICRVPLFNSLLLLFHLHAFRVAVLLCSSSVEEVILFQERYLPRFARSFFSKHHNLQDTLAIPTDATADYSIMMDHLTSKLAAANLFDMVVTATASAQVTIHTEKAAHITSKMGAAGLNGVGVVAEVKDTTPSSTSAAKAAATSSTSSKSGLNPGEWAGVGIVIALILISIAAGIFFAMRRRRQRYGAVGGKQKGAMVEKDVFNAEIQEPESESLQQQEAGLRDNHFESGYDNADSHYDGSDYVVQPAHGDKRAQYGA
jgi:hypothetical protein